MKDRELIIKKFVADEYRPEWMIEMMCYIRRFFPFKNFHEMTTEELLQWIENARRHVDEEKEIYLEAARRLTSATIYPSDFKPMDKRP